MIGPNEDGKGETQEKVDGLSEDIKVKDQCKNDVLATKEWCTATPYHK